MESLSLLALPYFPDFANDCEDHCIDEYMQPWSSSQTHPPSGSPTYPHSSSSPYHPQPHKGVAAGVAIAVTAVALTPVLNQAPVYEGSVELRPQSVQPTSRYTTPAPQIQPNIAPPSLIALPAALLTSHSLLDPVVQQLNLPNYESLVKNLTLTNEGDRLLVHYRDADPQQVQLVLSRLAQAYVEYGQKCQSGTCKGIKTIEAQIPVTQARLQVLKTKIEQLQQRYGVSDLQAQLELLETRTVEVERETVQVQGKLTETAQAYKRMNQQIAWQLTPASSSSSSAEIANQFLSQNSRYRKLLSQFQVLDQQLGDRFSSLSGEQNDIEALYTQHQRLTLQLSQQARSILPEYLTSPAANTQNPLLQNPNDLQLLQQSILTLSTIQMMQARQVTLGLAQQDLERQRSQMIGFLGHYDQLRHNLDLETNSLQRHFDQLKALQKQAKPDVMLKVTEVPQLMHDSLGQAVAIVPNLQQNLGIGIALGALAGIGALAALERKRVQSTESAPESSEVRNLSVDILMNRAKKIADLKIQSQSARAA